MTKFRHNNLIRLIALFKLVKAILLIAAGLGALALIHKNVAEVLERCVTTLGLDPGNHYITVAQGKATRLTPNKIRAIGVVGFVYAGLFLTEGVGLWLEKRWAEWFTIIITSSLVPVELYEIHRHSTLPKVFVLILNIAIVAYLVYGIRHEPNAES